MAASITPGIRQVYLVDPYTGLPDSDGGSSQSAIFLAAGAAIADVAAQDIWEVTAGAKRVVIRGCLLNQFSDFGDAQAEILSVLILRGTAAGTGGTPVTLQPVKSGNLVTPTATVVRNNTGTGAGGTLLLADGWNVAAGWTYLPAKAERIELAPGERGVIRISAPADSLSVNQTLIIEEINP